MFLKVYLDAMPAMEWVMLIIAVGAGAALAGMLALRRRRSSGKGRGEAGEPKWAAVLDRRGLVVEEVGNADMGLAVYAVQAARVMEEAGRLVELRAKLEDVTLEVLPQENGLYRVVAR